MNAAWLYRFEEANELPLSLVGGKGLNLVRLAGVGLPVPGGVIVTTAAYAVREEQGEAVCAAIREAYGQLGGGRVAVRSSATGEDLEDASFAGQQATFLNVEGETALVEAVRACWDSLFAERAVAYRRSRGIPDGAAAMAVVVQRMVDAEAAGVLFTLDPTDGEGRRALIEGAWGLGEAVVSGRVTPDRWTLDRESGAVLSEAIAEKAVRVTAEGEVGVPEEWRRVPCLIPEELSRLFELGRRVEREYGVPQDLEWAVAGGELFLLQTRSITAGAADREQVRQEEIARVWERSEPGGTVWARYSLAEVLPEPLPMSWALWRECMTGRGGYGRMYRELGYDPDPDLDTDGVVDLIAGRPYFHLGRHARIFFRDYPFDYPFAKLKANPELAIYPTPEVNLARAPKGFLFKLPALTRKMLAAEKRLERAAEEVPAHLEATLFPRMEAMAAEWREKDLSRMSPAEVVGAFGKVRAAVMDEFVAHSLKPGVLAGLALEKLEGELRSALGAAARAGAERLLVGVRPSPDCDLAGALERLAAGTLDRETFLEQFGHRGPGEMELANPRWRENPVGLGNGATGVGRSATAGHPRAGVEPVGALVSLDEVVGGKRINRARAELYLERARRFTALRETSKHFLMLGYEGLRRLLLEIDRRFELHGGVFYLEPEELARLVAGEDLRERIAGRRRRRALALSLEAPRVLFSDDLEAVGRPVEVAASEVLGGTGVSAGSAEGEALVVRRPEEAPEGVSGFILVCPSTDPGWTPLFLRARGLVLETGGVLSHGAIVARELGLPAVANVAEACARIRTGEWVSVDGTGGRVFRKDEG